MIPKTIHYCWFGRGVMPQLAEDCIASWHKYLPGYEYKLWNEDNFDIQSVPYVREAYESRKFAFVTDYVRLYALYLEGGIYMDTDVEILKPLDDLLLLPAFTGYEGSKRKPPVTGLMASEASGAWVKEQLDAYDGLHFIQEDGSLDLTPNTVRITEIMKANGFVPNGEYQVEYFCPRQTTGEVLITEDTYCDHHFMGSWTNGKSGWKSKLANSIGKKGMIRLIKLKRKLFG